MFWCRLEVDDGRRCLFRGKFTRVFALELSCALSSKRAALCAVLACWLLIAVANADEPIFDINIPAQPVAEALEQLAEQTGTLTFFPYNLAADRQANAVTGGYTLPDALDALLRDTGLSGVLAEERVIGIAADSDGAAEPPETGLGTQVPVIVPSQSSSSRSESRVERIEEITVTGIRGSLQRSAELKRKSGGIVDAITAEELGKFPDINVAESLQRITGVGITRTRGGEGQFVTVRGIGEEFNAVTYNGRLLATENNGREFSFDVIASELIAGAEVYKSLTASQGDGSLGGRVNIRTARPLDREGFRASASVASQYEDLAQEWGPRASAVIGNSNAAGTLGFVASISYQNRDTRTDVAESTFLIPDAQVDADGLINASLDRDGDGFNDTTGATITNTGVRFNGFAPSVSLQNRERIGGTFALQYRPNETTDIVFDGLYTNFDSPGTLFGYSYFPSAFSGNFTGTNAVVNGFNQAVAFDIEPFALDLVSRLTEGRAETFALGLNVEKSVSEKVGLIGDISYSSAEGNRDNFGSANGSGTFFVLGYPSNPVWSFDTTNGITPNATFGAENVIGDGFITPIADLTAEDIRLHFARRDTIDVEDDILSFNGAMNYSFSEKRRLSIGIDYVTREKTNSAFDNSGQDRQGIARGYGIRVADNSPQLIPGLLTLFDDNFLSDAPGNFPRVFPTFTVADLESAFADAGFASALVATLNENASSVVKETVLGAFLQFDADGTMGDIPFEFNVGVRFARTELTSSGADTTLDSILGSIVLRNDDGVTLSASQAFQVAPTTPGTFKNDYFDVLPAINLGLDLTPSIKLRLAASQSLSRPTLTDLSTRFVITSENLGGEQVTIANPFLDAIRSNNFDASLEWYGDNGSFVSAAFFHKEIANFVTSRVTTQVIFVPRQIQEGDGSLTDAGLATVSFLVSAPANGDSATIAGVEFGGQYLFDSGFGVAGNITFTDSEASSAGVKSTLENISDLSWNASAFYEVRGVQLRASMNHRSNYLIGQTVEGGLDEYADDFTQLDLSLSYAFETDTIDYRFFVEGINVTNEKVIRLSEFPDSNFLEAYEDNGARYVIGLRANF